MCKHTPFLPIITPYINNVRITWLDQVDIITRTTRGDDPLASSCFFFQCKHMAKSGITHVDPRVRFRKNFFGFWGVSDNPLIPYLQRCIQRRGRWDLMDGWLEFFSLLVKNTLVCLEWNHCSPRTPVIQSLTVGDDVFLLLKKNLQMEG